jgi:adenosylcobyric acid synthase
VLNRFHGDPALLGNAMDWLKEMTGVPTAAIIPFIRHALPEEDTLHHRDRPVHGNVNIALIAYPYASNLDEFDPLINEPGVTVVPIRDSTPLGGYAAIILPGSKNTGASLHSMRESGLDVEVARAAARGVPVLGVCGGMQLLGGSIHDPEGLETVEPEGLGLLDITTTLMPEKTTRQREVAWQGGGVVRGYEIHHGVTTPGPRACAHLEDGLGWQQGSVRGVYLHGLLENTAYRQDFLSSLGWRGQAVDWQARMDAEIERVASLVEASGWMAGR